MARNVGGKAADQYLLQRIVGASPEQLAALLLEGGQRFIGLALQSMANHDASGQGRSVNRVSDIILSLREQLNHEEGGELVENLARIYDWWMDELFKGAMANEVDRLQRVSHQMSELRVTWEALHRRKTGGDQPPTPSISLEDLSV